MRIAFKKAPKAALKGAVRAYQAVHPAFFSGSCRFHPTCSHYALEALETHGALRGSVLTAHRIWRCQPMYPAGFDPVPPRGPLLRALAAWRYLGPTPWQRLWAALRLISLRRISARFSEKNLNASPTDVKARMT
jgi:uncharacterized protein